MNNSPLPQEEDPNVLIEQEIFDRLFNDREPFDIHAPLWEENFGEEMRPYIYPDAE
jgi:hypothetical protein